MPAKNKQKTYQEDLESNSVLVQGEVLGLRLTDVVQNSLFTFCDPQAASLPPSKPQFICKMDVNIQYGCTEHSARNFTWRGVWHIVHASEPFLAIITHYWLPLTNSFGWKVGCSYKRIVIFPFKNPSGLGASLPAPFPNFPIPAWHFPPEGLRLDNMHQ